MLATLGSWVLRFLFGWAAWEATHSAFWVGAIAGLLLVPTFVLSPLFGIAADRFNPRNGLIITTLLQGVVAGLVAVVYQLNALTLGWLGGLALLFGCVTAAHTPIRLALLPRLVERAALPSAIGYSAMMFNSSRIVGPAIAAWLLTEVPVPAVFAVSAVIMVIAAGLLSRVQVNIPALAQRNHGSFFSQLRDGIRYSARHPAIRGVFLLTLTSGFLGRPFVELLPAVSGLMLDGDPATLATLTASAGVGSVFGGLIVSRQGGQLSQLFSLVLFGLTLASLVMFTASFWDAVLSVSIAVAIISLCTTMVGTGNQALAQLMVEESYRGRVMSLWTVVAMGVPAVGAILVGIMADRLGFPLAFGCCAAFALTVVVFNRRRVALLGRPAAAD